MTGSLSTIDLALSILELSDDGDRLDPSHLALLQAAVNGAAKPEGINRLREIFSELKADTYLKPWLQRIKPLTATHDGYILYKNSIVEHYNHPYDPSNKDSLEDLARRCRHIEALGLIPSTSLTVFHWDWLSDLTRVPPQLPNALSLYELYRHTQTDEIIGHFNYRVPAKQGFITMYRKSGTWSIYLPADTEEDWISDYHGVQRNGYQPVRFAEPSNTGLSGQPREPLLALLEAIQLPTDIHKRVSVLVQNIQGKNSISS